VSANADSVVAALHQPVRRAWKVLVLGNSVATIVVPARRSRHDGTYPEVLEWLLQDAGYAVTVHNSSRPFDQIGDGVRRFMDEERHSLPDVLVVQFGTAEHRQAVVPWFVLRHLHGWDKGVRQPSLAYRRFVAPHLWRGVRAYQRFLCARIGLRTWRTSPARFARELRRLTEAARAEHMLVLVADPNPPGPRILAFMPGLEERWEVYRRLVADVVAGFEDDDVRLVAMSEVAQEMGVDEALPDALHFSAPAHRRVAAMMAAEIAPWLDAQGDERRAAALR
jgi:lysophospholipase L1-like esterase